MQRQQKSTTQAEQTPDQRRQLDRRYRFSYTFIMACFGSILGVAAYMPFQWYHPYRTAPEGMEGVVVALALVMEAIFLGNAWWAWKVAKQIRAALQAFLTNENAEHLR